MLEISNIENGKSEWNLNETHIIIPVLDGDGVNKESDKILTNTLTLSSLDGGDQTMLANALEPSFVIGLDKNLFETPNFKSDLVIIQNSDLKYSSGQTDLKNSVSYTISYVDQDKSEILFQSPVPKGRICASDKALLEVRNVLNYNDSVHELEKAEDQINANANITSQAVKTNSNILLEKTIGSEKKLNYFNYFAAPQDSVTLPIEEGLITAKPSENLELEEKKCFLTVERSCTVEENAHGNTYDISKSLVEYNDSQPFSIVDCKTDRNGKIDLKKNKEIRVENAEREKISEKGSNSLLEKSLPLKKKAKMKRTLTSFTFDNQKSLPKQEVAAVNQSVDIKFSKGKKIKQALMTNKFLKNEKNSYDECLKNKLLNQKKTTDFKIDSKKLKKCITGSLPQGDEKKSFEFDNDEDEIVKTDISGFDKNKFNNINDLLDCLRRCRMINATVWQILNSGLKEMKVDILKEMNAKNCAKISSENTNYSPQLKAFALVLYFKQPAAFNYLSQTYKNGWPSLKVIKKWKRRMNSYQRPNFVRVQGNTEN